MPEQIPIEQVYGEIKTFARECGVKKLILFGSRARGTNHDKSDIDLAVFADGHFDEFNERIQDELWSLLRVDLIDMDGESISKALAEEIGKDGVILYEKI